MSGKKYILALWFCYVAVCSFSALAAGNVIAGKVVNVDVRANGLFLITFNQSSSTPASCVTVANRMSGDASTAGGKAIVATALAAMAASTPVTLAQGLGTCNEYPGIESIGLLSLGQ